MHLKPKGKHWIISKYYKSVGNDHWRFYCVVKDKGGKEKYLYLKNAAATPIRRHHKIEASANPFDPKYKKYFRQRKEERKARGYTTDHVKYAGLL